MYVIIVQAIYNQNPRINHINTAILKSPHHIQAHLEIKICKKKNINIPSAQIIQLSIAMSVKFIQKYFLNKIKLIIDIIIINISYISLSHLSIIIYNHIKIAIDKIIANIHIVKLWVVFGMLDIIEKFGKIVCAHKIIVVTHIQIANIISGISKKRIS